MQFGGSVLWAICAETWDLLLDASFYILIGLVAGGLLKAFLSPGYVAAHLGRGRFRSVWKASLLGIPLPLCSCGVLPAAAALKKQGASNGATTAFLIATPESGVDSISVSWVLLDPLMTLFRPVAALVTALVAGIGENLLHPPPRRAEQGGRPPAFVSRDRKDVSRRGFSARIQDGMRYAVLELWGDLAGPFFIGLLIAGAVAALVPDDFLQAYLGGGLSSMLVMLICGIPLYICATASTPIAAALVLKGVSPGAVLVFLLAGPATNIATITVLTRLLGKRSTVLYLATIAGVSLLFGLALDQVYAALGLSARAEVGKAAEITPEWLRYGATLLILLLSVRPLARIVGKLSGREEKGCDCPPCGEVQRPLSTTGLDGGPCSGGCRCSESAGQEAAGIASPSTAEEQERVRPGNGNGCTR